MTVPMEFNRSQLDQIEMRVQEALRHSDELICQSKALRASTISLLNRFDQALLLDKNGEAHAKDGPLRASRNSILDWAVDAALQITNATKANLQVVDPASGVLLIAAQRGFKYPFLDFFMCVHGGKAACGTAFETRRRVIVEDVTESPVFHGTDALEVLLDAGVRAVQSTPLIGSSGTILGILSTHWPSPSCLDNRTLASLDVLARTTALCLERT
jgi:hypothetical protein